MKNLLIYISPNHQFNPEHAKMIEVQIENSLDYWDRDDIVLLTNFPYEYKGIKAILGTDNLINSQYWTHPRGIINSKINGIIYLLENKLIDELTWFHDFDAFQLAPLDLPEIKDIGLVCYGVYPPSKLHPLNGRKDFKHRINCGNIFFKPESLDIFKQLLFKMDSEGLYEEDAFTLMVDANRNNFMDRVSIMNQTYNLGIRCLKDNIKIADKPLRVSHFPPHEKWREKFRPILGDKLNSLIDEKFTHIRQSK
jgi:hypothetical protein